MRVSARSTWDEKSDRVPLDSGCPLCLALPNTWVPSPSWWLAAAAPVGPYCIYALGVSRIFRPVSTGRHRRAPVLCRAVRVAMQIAWTTWPTGQTTYEPQPSTRHCKAGKPLTGSTPSRRTDRGVRWRSVDLGFSAAAAREGPSPIPLAPVVSRFHKTGREPRTRPAFPRPPASTVREQGQTPHLAARAPRAHSGAAR